MSEIDVARADVRKAMNVSGFRTNPMGEKTIEEVFDKTTGAFLLRHAKDNLWSDVRLSGFVTKVCAAFALEAMSMHRNCGSQAPEVSRLDLIAASKKVMHKYYDECRQVLETIGAEGLMKEHSPSGSTRMFMAMCGDYLTDIDNGTYP